MASSWTSPTAATTRPTPPSTSPTARSGPPPPSPPRPRPDPALRRRRRQPATCATTTTHAAATTGRGVLRADAARRGGQADTVPGCLSRELALLPLLLLPPGEEVV